MPEYDYFCDNCDHVWSEYKSIDNRYVPVDNVCPECGMLGFVRKVISNNISLIDKAILDFDKNIERCGVLDNLNRIKTYHPEMKWKG